MDNNNGGCKWGREARMPGMMGRGGGKWQKTVLKYNKKNPTTFLLKISLYPHCSPLMLSLQVIKDIFIRSINCRCQHTY